MIEQIFFKVPRSKKYLTHFLIKYRAILLEKIFFDNYHLKT